MNFNKIFELVIHETLLNIAIEKNNQDIVELLLALDKVDVNVSKTVKKKANMQTGY